MHEYDIRHEGSLWKRPLQGLHSSFDDEKMVITFAIDDGEEEKEYEVRACFEVCPCCDGKGKVVNPNIDDCGITMEEFRDDPDFFEDYKSGKYDITCQMCEGKRVIPTVDEGATNKETLEIIETALSEEEDYKRLCRMERMMGA